jgi:DNA-binding NarL/FixJ family response regulator
LPLALRRQLEGCCFDGHGGLRIESAATLIASPPAPLALVLPRVAVVARHDGLRARVVAALAETDVALASVLTEPADAALAVLATARDLVVLACADDVALAQRTINTVRRELGDTPLIVVAAHEGADARRLTRAALRSRLHGLVLASTLERALAPTVQSVLAGQMVMPRLDSPPSAEALSHREKQVLGLVALGHSNAYIATRLFLAPSTVKSHLTSIFAKLGVTSRHEAAMLVLDPDETIGAAVLAMVEPDSAE